MDQQTQGETSEDVPAFSCFSWLLQIWPGFLRRLSRRRSGLTGEHCAEETEERQKPHQGLGAECLAAGMSWREGGALLLMDPCSHQSHSERGPSLSACAWTTWAEPGPGEEPREITYALPWIYLGDVTRTAQRRACWGELCKPHPEFSNCAVPQNCRWNLLKPQIPRTTPRAAVFLISILGDSDHPVFWEPVTHAIAEGTLTSNWHSPSAPRLHTGITGGNITKNSSASLRI